ncbi:MAG: hypothetical protein EP330_11370 [Deltaproteobacteria bacterium]|nr:MAG: hypothetical protein EP330_11370 [Deltaproteobacteria bacterium]
MGLAAGLGFDARAFGPLSQARLLEPLAMVWAALRDGMGRGFALGALRRERARKRPGRVVRHNDRR